MCLGLILWSLIEVFFIILSSKLCLETMKSIGVCCSREDSVGKWRKEIERETSDRNHWSNKMNMRFVQWKIHLKMGQITRWDSVRRHINRTDQHSVKEKYLLSSILLLLLWSLHRTHWPSNCPRMFIKNEQKFFSKENDKVTDCLSFLFQTLLTFIPFFHLEQPMSTGMTSRPWARLILSALIVLCFDFGWWWARC